MFSICIGNIIDFIRTHVKQVHIKESINTIELKL